MGGFEVFQSVFLGQPQSPKETSCRILRQCIFQSWGKISNIIHTIYSFEKSYILSKTFEYPWKEEEVTEGRISVARGQQGPNGSTEVVQGLRGVVQGQLGLFKVNRCCQTRHQIWLKPFLIWVGFSLGFGLDSSWILGLGWACFPSYITTNPPFYQKGFYC